MRRFLSFYWKADTVYDIHSPFVFEFANAVLEDQRNFYAFEEIEFIRKQYLKDTRTIQVEDYGAGSLVDKRNERKISSIAKNALSSPYRAKLLFRLINLYKPENLIELGTSLGISALYQASANYNAQLITLEGSTAIANLARQSFQQYNNPVQIKLLQGQFKDTLPKALKEVPKLDYAFIDGNHRKQPTLDYFETCYQYAHEDSIFVFDDIHWSEEMEEAWDEICKDERVRLSIDLFYCGIIFFKKEFRVKEHYNIVAAKWKPWSMGFFGK